MKKLKSAKLVVLIILFCIAVFLGYSNYIYWQDRHSIESIIMNDSRFHDVQVTTKGIGIILRGHVKSKADMEDLYSEINKIKRGRVDASISIGE